GVNPRKRQGHKHSLALLPHTGALAARSSYAFPHAKGPHGLVLRPRRLLRAHQNKDLWPIIASFFLDSEIHLRQRAAGAPSTGARIERCDELRNWVFRQVGGL